MMTMTLTNRDLNTSDDDVDHGGIVPGHYHDNHIVEIADNDGDIVPGHYHDDHIVEIADNGDIVAGHYATLSRSSPRARDAHLRRSRSHQQNHCYQQQNYRSSQNE